MVLYFAKGEINDWDVLVQFIAQTALTNVLGCYYDVKRSGK